MKPEFAERLFVESLVQGSIQEKKIKGELEEVEKLTGDASTRRYYRVKTPEDTFVVCLDNPVKSDKGRNEFLEVQKVLEGAGVRVPRIYDHNIKKGYILEEDLGDETLLKTLGRQKNEKAVLKYYKNSIELLLKVHALDTQKYLDQSFTKLAFDAAKLTEEIEFTYKFFFKEFLGHEVSKKQDEKLRAGFGELVKKLAKQRRVLTHRDFHSRNIMMKGKEQILIDFQDARLGIPQYDLVSILEDCYFSLTPETKDELKDFYWDSFLKETKLQSSKEEYLYLYDLMAIQRIFKAIGSFSYIFKTRGDHRYIKYIGFAFENLKLLIQKHSEFKSLRETLGEIYYEY